MRLAINIPKIDTFSDEEFYSFCRANPELRIERNELGQIVIMPPTGIETSFRNSDLNFRLYSWNLKSGLGRVSDSNGGYTLPDSSMRAPDVAWISNERLATIPASELKRFAHVCPDFVIELMSESDELEDLQEKMKKWIGNGTRLAWLIDPKKRETHVFFEGKESEMVKFKDTLSGHDVLPGLELILDSIL